MKKNLKNVFWIQTYVEPNLVFFIFSGYGGRGGPKKKFLSVLNINFQYISIYSETYSRFGIFEIREKKFSGGGEKIKVAQNVLKHALVLEFFKSEKKSCSDFDETYSHFRIFKIRDIFFLGGGSKNKSCSECAETCSRFGIFEIWQKLFGGG